MQLRAKFRLHSVDMGCVARFLLFIMTGFVLIILASKIHAKGLKTFTYYADFERINVTYYNPKYLKNVKVSALRYSRRDPIHYVSLHGDTLVPMGNNVSMDIYIHEFLSNEYRRSFVEMHYKICDFILKDTIFRPFIEQSLPKTCPLPVGSYSFENISFPNLPLLSSFPFQKGRSFLESRTRSERVIEGYLDMEIKQRWR